MFSQLETRKQELKNPEQLAALLKSGNCPAGLGFKLIVENLSVEGAKVIAEALKSGNCPVGFRLKLIVEKFVAGSPMVIAEAFKSDHCPVDFQFCLDTNDVGAEWATAVAEVLKSGNCRAGLQINLRGTSLWSGVETIAQGAIALAKAFKIGKCPVGLRIGLEQNLIGVEGATAIAEALESGGCPADFQIDLSMNYIGAQGAEALAKALESRRCPVGLQIGLYMNLLRVEGAKSIARALASGNCPAGLQIDFGSNYIGDEGAKAIAEALASGNCPVGLTINLRTNHIGAQGAKAIAEALASGNCPAGLRINLRSNRIGTEGVKAIAKALESGKCPLDLQIFLDGYSIGAEEARAIEEALESGRCPDGVHLEMSQNGHINEEFHKRIQEALEIHRATLRANAIFLIPEMSNTNSDFGKLPFEVTNLILAKIFSAKTIHQARAHLDEDRAKRLMGANNLRNGATKRRNPRDTNKLPAAKRKKLTENEGRMDFVPAQEKLDLNLSTATQTCSMLFFQQTNEALFEQKKTENNLVELILINIGKRCSQSGDYAKAFTLLLPLAGKHLDAALTLADVLFGNSGRIRSSDFSGPAERLKKTCQWVLTLLKPWANQTDPDARLSCLLDRGIRGILSNDNELRVDTCINGLLQIQSSSLPVKFFSIKTLKTIGQTIYELSVKSNIQHEKLQLLANLLKEDDEVGLEYFNVLSSTLRELIEMGDIKTLGKQVPQLVEFMMTQPLPYEALLYADKESLLNLAKTKMSAEQAEANFTRFKRSKYFAGEEDTSDPVITLAQLEEELFNLFSPRRTETTDRAASHGVFAPSKGFN